MITTTTPKPDRIAIRDALIYMRSEYHRQSPPQFTKEYDAAIEEYERHAKVLVSAGICPSCASAEEPMVSHLGDWQPGDYWNHAGRSCPNCEEFYICGEQPEYEPDPWMGDADPGL